MPQIPTYDDRISAQGGLNVQSSPSDFGAQVGAATEKFGQELGQAGEQIYKVYSDNERIQAYADQAQMMVNQKTDFDQKVKSLNPNDPDYQDKLNNLTTEADAD